MPPPPPLPDPDRPLASFGTDERWRPARLSERGVSLPFTTPFLLGGRMRAAERGGAELVLAAPLAGGGAGRPPPPVPPGMAAGRLGRHPRAVARRPADGAGALHDMALLVPAMPTEAGEWAGFDAAGRMEALREGLRLWRRAAAPPADASAAAGRIAELTARNEGLRALCA